MASGVAGVNLHGHLENCGGYAPLCASRSRLFLGRLRPQPEWYALLLTRALLGDVAVRVESSSHDPRLDTTAFASPSGIVHVVIVDSAPAGSRTQKILLKVPGRYTSARATILTAPSLTATSDVTLGGRTIAANGTWRGPKQVPVSLNRESMVTIDVKPSSAMLISFYRR
jgi:Glycosyl hydrolase family 79 C-terminal beta domain/Glycosyl hydrolase family 30 beta sandwich domain